MNAQVVSNVIYLRIILIWRKWSGADKALEYEIEPDDNFDGIEKVDKLMAAIQNYLKDERTEEKNSSERNGQVRSEISQRRGSNSSQQGTILMPNL